MVAKVGGGAGLSTPVGGKGAGDPGLDEAWWWLGLPLGLAIFLIAVHAVSPDWYRAYVLPEGYGFLELGHFLMPLIGLVVAARIIAQPAVRARPLVFATATIGALACFYIAGEEMSWGQHFFQRRTPEFWSQVNRQQETNLHNTLDIFDKTPRMLVEVGVFAGGLLVPLAAMFLTWVRDNRLAIFLPADAMVPTALGALLFKVMATLEKEAGITPLVTRPSEATESYLYLFILFYLIVFARRVRALAPP